MKSLARLLAVCTASILSVQGQSESRVLKPDFTISNAITNKVGPIAYSSNGQWLAVGVEHSVDIYELHLGGSINAKLTRTLKSDSPIQAITFRNSNILASLSQDRSVTTWNSVTGNILRRLSLDFVNFNVVTFAPGDLPILAAGSLNHVRLWNYLSGESLSAFDTTDSNVSTMAFTPDGKLLVVGTHKGVLRVLDVATRKVTRTIDLDSPIRALSASTKYIVLGYADGTLAELGFGGQTSTREVFGHNDTVTAIAFNPRGERFASGGTDGAIKIWDTKSLKLLFSLNGSAGAILSVAFVADGRTLLSSTTNGIVNGWHLPTK
jgi:WD40 repeat protein